MEMEDLPPQRVDGLSKATGSRARGIIPGDSSALFPELSSLLFTGEPSAVSVAQRNVCVCGGGVGGWGGWGGGWWCSIFKAPH